MIRNISVHYQVLYCTSKEECSPLQEIKRRNTADYRYKQCWGSPSTWRWSGSDVAFWCRSRILHMLENQEFFSFTLIHQLKLLYLCRQRQRLIMLRGCILCVLTYCCVVVPRACRRCCCGSTNTRIPLCAVESTCSIPPSSGSHAVGCDLLE